MGDYGGGSGRDYGELSGVMQAIWRLGGGSGRASHQGLAKTGPARCSQVGVASHSEEKCLWERLSQCRISLGPAGDCMSIRATTATQFHDTVLGGWSTAGLRLSFQAHAVDLLARTLLGRCGMGPRSDCRQQNLLAQTGLEGIQFRLLQILELAGLITDMQ